MVTLADALHEARGKTFDIAAGGAIAAISDVISVSQRFVFSQDATDTCENLGKSKPSSLLDATKFCRLPFKKVWVEFSPNRAGRAIQPADWPKDVRVNPPLKIGCLLECLDDTFQRFGCTLAWEHDPEFIKTNPEIDTDMSGRELRKAHGPCIQICPIGYVVNWHDDWLLGDTVSILNDSLGREMRAGLKAYGLGKYASNQKEIDAAILLAKRRTPSIVPYCRKQMEELAKTRSFMGMKKITETCSRDWEGEYQLIIAMLCLLNSKNCVSVEPQDLSKLNKSRRLSGKKPLLSYSNVSINLSRRDIRKANMEGLSEAEIREHLVRGHFKVRKSGVFFWRPFIRGDAAHGEVRRSGYTVVDRKPSVIPSAGLSSALH